MRIKKPNRIFNVNGDNEKNDILRLGGLNLFVVPNLKKQNLTSLDDADLAKQGLNITYKDLVRRRTELAKEWGLDGIVCPANAAGALEKEFGYDPNFIFVTPGIEWAGVHREGQKQLYTPDLAIRDCKNSTLVIGGAITKLPDKTQRRRAANEINSIMALELQKQYQN